MAVNTVFGRSGDVVADVSDYAPFYAPLALGIPAGGLLGQVLTKHSDTSFDADWENPTGLAFTPENVANKVTSFGAVTDVQYPSALLVQTALSGKLNANVAIVAATKTKIQYDVNGLVLAGFDATTVDIADSTDKRYVTDAQKVTLGSQSGVNTGDQDLSAYALVSDLATTNSNVAALSASLVNYALESELANTNVNVAANTAMFANYATLADLAVTNANVDALSMNLSSNYATLDQVNAVSSDLSTLTANLSDPTFIEGNTAAEVKLSFSNGLTRDGSNNVTNDLVAIVAPAHSYWGNSLGISAVAAWTQPTAADFADGTTGTGKLVLDNSPTIQTPTLTGPTLVQLTDSNVSTAPTSLALEHEFAGGGVIVPGFGTTLEFRARSTTTSGQTQGAIRTTWTDPTDGSRSSEMVFSPVLNGVAVDYFWLNSDGSAGLGANGSSGGNGVLWLQGGLQMPGVGVVGNVLRDNGGMFVPAKLDASDVSGQVSTCPSVKTTTTDQTTATEGLHFSIPLVAGSVVGTTWKVTVWGNADNIATATQFVVYLRWGGLMGTFITSSEVFQSAVAQTNRDWRVEFLVTITSVGTNGTARAMSVTHEHTSANGSITVGQRSTGATDVVNVNTTIATTLVVSGICSVAPAGTHLRVLGGIAELVRK